MELNNELSVSGNYVAPEIKVLEISSVQIITQSGDPNPFNEEIENGGKDTWDY